MSHEPRRRRSWLIFDVSQNEPHATDSCRRTGAFPARPSREHRSAFGRVATGRGISSHWRDRDPRRDYKGRCRRASSRRGASIRQRGRASPSLLGFSSSSRILSRTFSCFSRNTSLQIRGTWLSTTESKRNQRPSVPKSTGRRRIGFSDRLAPPEQNRANKAPEPTTFAVTSRATVRLSEMKQQNAHRDFARAAPAKVVAHL